MSDSNPLGALTGLVGGLGGGQEAGGLDLQKIIGDLTSGDGDAKARLTQSFQSLAPAGAAPSAPTTNHFVTILQSMIASPAGADAGAGGGLMGMVGSAASMLSGGGGGGGLLKALPAILPLVVSLLKKPAPASSETAAKLGAIGQELDGAGVAPQQSNQLIDALKKMLADSAAKMPQ